MTELQFDYDTGINNADFDSLEENPAVIASAKDISSINYDSRRKIENMLEEKALRKLLEDEYAL